MLHGVIDLGSNTVRLSLYRIENGKLRTSYLQKKTVGLISYIDKEQYLSEEGIIRAVEIVLELKAVAKKKRVQTLSIIATAAIRNIHNSADVITEIQMKTKLHVKLLSGEEEALMGLSGIMQEYQFSDGVFVDIGGGSTEIVIYQNNEVIQAFSMPIGSLNTYLNKVKKLLPTKSELKKIEYTVIDALSKEVKKLVDIDQIYGVGGTLNALRKIYQFKEMGAMQEVITFKHIKQILKSVDVSEKDSYLTLIRIVPERIHTIVPGLAIMKAIFKFFNAQTLHVSKYGIREGYVLNQFKG